MNGKGKSSWERGHPAKCFLDKVYENGNNDVNLVAGYGKSTVWKPASAALRKQK